jgi:hypothetical protein
VRAFQREALRRIEGCTRLGKALPRPGLLVVSAGGYSMKCIAVFAFAAD